MNTLRNTLLSLTAAGLLAAALMAPSATSAHDPNGDLLVETVDLAVLIDEPGLGLTDNLRIVDVRDPFAFAEGHIPGAVHLFADTVIDPRGPFDGAFRDDAELVSLLSARDIQKGNRIVIYGDQGGLHATRLFWMLSTLGYDDVAILYGGWPKWWHEGHRVSDRIANLKAGS